MSAERPDWQPQAPASWKITLPIPRALAQRVAEGLAELDGFDPPPVLVASEPDPARPEAWQLDAYFEGPPDPAAVAILERLSGVAAAPEQVEDADWVTISQAWLEPIRAGRFFVHTAAHADAVPAGVVPFRIEAGRAFGTGHHETTSGCMELLSTLAEERRRFERVADIGTGTGLLAFAALAMWPGAAVVATDIDPVAIPVVVANMEANGIRSEAIVVGVADGTAHPALEPGGFDLVIANILAGPLIALAPDIAAILADGGSLLLAGLLSTQQGDVAAAYAAQGIAIERHLTKGDWAILLLRKD